MNPGHSPSPEFQNPQADFYVPAASNPDDALAATTHLGIGAHQDDLEFMAMRGILECYDREDQWFGGVICTDGSGSARTGPFAGVSDEEMREIRAEEQREAARKGRYSFIAQLAYPSSAVKDPARHELVQDLVRLLEKTSPHVVYTHNLADKHATHVAVTASVLAAIRQLPPARRPQRLIGCEVWRDLDWLPDDKKVVMDVSAHPELARELNATFKSQISGGKRYDLAVDGRRHAHATFFESHAVDRADRLTFGMDLTPLIADDGPSPSEYVGDLIREFEQSVQTALEKYLQRC